MVNEDSKHEHLPPFYAPAETLVCKRCGRDYVSSGKRDTGYCCECRNTKDAILKGGPYDGMRNSGLLEDD